MADASEASLGFLMELIHEKCRRSPRLVKEDDKAAHVSYHSLYGMCGKSGRKHDHSFGVKYWILVLRKGAEWLLPTKQVGTYIHTFAEALKPNNKVEAGWS